VLVLAVTLGACAPGVAPLPAPTPAPGRDSAPTVVVPPDRRVLIARELPMARYEVRLRTTLRLDSLGTPVEEQMSSEGTISFQGRRGPSAASPSLQALQATGRVEGYRVSTSTRVRDARTSALPGAAASLPASGEPVSAAFEAVFDSVLARITPTPALANECDHPAAAAVSVARELLLRLPETLSNGQQWQDSARVFTCRNGVPITVQLVHATRVTALSADGRQATLERTVQTRADGRLALGWRTVSLQGSGNARYTITLRVPDGVVERVEGTGEMRFDASDSARPSARVTRVDQRTQYEARRLSP
jgi:hypothetical protein